MGSSDVRKLEQGLLSMCCAKVAAKMASGLRRMPAFVMSVALQCSSSTFTRVTRSLQLLACSDVLLLIAMSSRVTQKLRSFWS